MTYIWLIAQGYPEKLIGEYDREISPDRFLFKECTHLELESAPTFRFHVKWNQLSKYDDLANNAMVPLISPKIIDILTKFGAQVQCIDAKVVTLDGELEGYKILNVLRKDRVLDREASEFNLIPGTDTIMAYNKVVYKNPTEQIARDADYMEYILVNQELGEYLQRNCNTLGIYNSERLCNGIIV